MFYSISACQALLNCCVGCLVTVILRDTSAESVLNKTPTIFSLYFMLLVFFPFSTYLSLAVFVSEYFSNGGKKEVVFKDRISLCFLTLAGRER